MKGFTRRQFLQASGSIAAVPTAAQLLLGGCSPKSRKITIACGAQLSSWEPTRGLSSLDAEMQFFYKAVFDSFIDQSSDRSLKPGILIDWGWNEDRSQIQMSVREDAFWHDGSPVTPSDVIWSLERAGNSMSGNPMHFIWNKVNNFSISGRNIVADVREYDPTIFKWMAHLTGYILPKHAYSAAKAATWNEQPVGSGPYIVENFEQGSSVLLKSFPQYWGPKPRFDSVLVKIIPDAEQRVAALENGECDLAIGVPFEEFNRLTSKSSWGGDAYPTSDIGLIFITNRESMMKDKNVRLAMHHAIDKQKLIDELLLGYGNTMSSMQVSGYDAYKPSIGLGRTMDSLQAPLFDAHDASIKIEFDPLLARDLLSKSGYSESRPVQLKIQTTKGYRFRDYEMVQMIVGMWREVGIEAEIELYTEKEHLRLRAEHDLAPAAFFNWSNPTGDPFMSTGLAMLSQSPDSSFKSAELDRLIKPLLNEPDERQRIRGYQEIDQYIADEGAVIPLVQYYQSVVHKSDLQFEPHAGGYVLPQDISSL